MVLAPMARLEERYSIMTLKMSRRIASALVAASVLAMSGPVSAQDVENNIWPSLKKDVFGDKEILDAKDMIVMEAPVRAEDAALVPISVKMPAAFATNVKSLTLVIDKNPSPVVGTFTYGPAAGTGDRLLATRVRINEYTDVRAIAETNDGKLYMTTKFVKASGGCSAPAGKDAVEAMKSMGKMQIKKLAGKEGDSLTQEAQVMIKHLNVTGMQMNQLTGLYPPARFVSKVEVKSGNDLIFTMTGGISISEDPNFRFTHGGKAGETIEVKAEDSDGAVFAGQSAGSQS